MTTSGDTLVIVPHASPGQLQACATIFALGHAGPDGTLLAKRWQRSCSSRQGGTSTYR